MVTTYRRSRPPIFLATMAAIAAVLGCILAWSYSFRWLESSARANETATQFASGGEPTSRFPTFALGPSPTPLPECQWFEVTASSALMRKCPDYSCEIRESRPFEAEVCVYGAASSDNKDFLSPDEWYVVDMNPRGAFRDLVYMHESVLKPLNPTPRPTKTFTPLPTVTLTPFRPATAVPLIPATLESFPTILATLPPPAESLSPEPPRPEF